jgi:dihydroorotate dehydrogenase electron transfer subunit
MQVAQSAALSLRATLVNRRVVGPDAFVLELEVPDMPPRLAPGVFAMLSPAAGGSQQIARPFSIYDRPTAQRFTFLIQQLGLGTRELVELALGAEILCTMPLGNGFEVATASEDVVILAGGVGSAPFLQYVLERIAAGAGANTHMILGARSRERLYDVASFENLSFDLRVATDDGSRGFHGHVIAALAAALDAGELNSAARFLACGPSGLLHGFASFAREHKLRAWLSLETYMGCGFGVCNGCPVATQADGPLGAWPYARTCIDGPVFSLDAIQF